MEIRQSYSFNQEYIVNILKKNPFFCGSSMSTWQSEPVLFYKNGKQIFPSSDWEFELEKNLNQKFSGIKLKQKIEELPHFFTKEKEYIKRSKELGQSMFRLSLEFGRLCPKSGVFDEKLMKEYVRVLVHLKMQDQEPMLTIQHFTMPLFLVKTNKNGKIIRGAWENPDVLKEFRFYVENVANFLSDKNKIREILIEEKVGEELQNHILDGGLVRYFISINEPIMTVQHGYINGIFPPFRYLDFLSIRKVLMRIISAHDITREVLKEKLKEYNPQIGVSYNWQNIDGFFGKIAHYLMNEMYTDMFERDGSHSDFLGLQYYFRKSFSLFVNHKKREYSDYPGFGDVYPKGILFVLEKMHKIYPKKEIFITEFGFADAEDKRRPYWILETFRYIIEAKKESIPIKSILLWSLVDNFEWHLGMSQKFAPFSEYELEIPLVSSIDGIRTWEVWKSINDIIANPSSNSLGSLQACYERAKIQYESFNHENRK